MLALLVVAACLEREKPDLGRLGTLDMITLLFLALGLAALEIGLKEAPERGWLSGAVLGLLAVAALSGLSFIRRTLKNAEGTGPAPPLVDLTLWRNRDFAIGCLLSFTFGIGLFGSVYLMPVFLGFVRGHGAFGIGQIMLITGAAQLLAAPVAVQLERRFDARLLTACGFALFAVGLGMSAFQTRETDMAEMFWPQVVRGSAIMLCLLPPTRLALGPLPAARVADGSGLFNLMRNLGGAIGLALIDTVIYSRAPDTRPGAGRAAEAGRYRSRAPRRSARWHHEGRAAWRDHALDGGRRPPALGKGRAGRRDQRGLGPFGGDHRHRHRRARIPAEAPDRRGGGGE